MKPLPPSRAAGGVPRNSNGKGKHVAEPHAGSVGNGPGSIDDHEAFTRDRP